MSRTLKAAVAWSVSAWVKAVEIMYAEVFYDYQPVVFGDLLPEATIYKTAAMYVRDDRDLSGIFNPDPQAPVNRC